MNTRESKGRAKGGSSGASARSPARPGFSGFDLASGRMAHSRGRDARANTADDGLHESPLRGWSDDSPEDSANETSRPSALPGGSDDSSIAVTTTSAPSETERFEIQ
jgi:hypothetical protein